MQSQRNRGGHVNGSRRLGRRIVRADTTNLCSGGCDALRSHRTEIEGDREAGSQEEADPKEEKGGPRSLTTVARSETAMSCPDLHAPRNGGRHVRPRLFARAALAPACLASTATTAQIVPPCPPGQYRISGVCLDARPCPSGSVLTAEGCVRNRARAKDKARQPSRSHGCPPGTRWHANTRQCVDLGSRRRRR